MNEHTTSSRGVRIFRRRGSGSHADALAERLGGCQGLFLTESLPAPLGRAMTSVAGSATGSSTASSPTATTPGDGDVSPTPCTTSAVSEPVALEMANGAGAHRAHGGIHHHHRAEEPRRASR